MSAQVRIGCSGWNYASWRERFYPRGAPPARWLEHYARHFDTVEVNSTFYRLASPDAVERWVAQTPEEFVFALKSSRYLTHIKRLTDLDRGVERFYERVGPLLGTPKLGPLLWQLPENFHRDDARLSAALAALPAGRHTFEFRHPSWFADEVYELLARWGVALAVGDTPLRPFQPHVRTTDWMFVRLHHGHRGRRGNYSHAELDAWAERVAEWGRQGDVFLYFNNDWEAFAIENARYLKRALGEG